jgi:hypothetical protein
MSRCIQYAEGYKYQLRACYAVRLPELADPARAVIATEWLELLPDGTLRILAGYAWDGASGPTYDSKSSMRPSLVHDALYQLIRHGLLPQVLRGVADRIFHRLCKEDGMWRARAWAWYHLVRIFAKPATDPAAESPDVSAGCGCQITPQEMPPEAVMGG